MILKYYEINIIKYEIHLKALFVETTCLWPKNNARIQNITPLYKFVIVPDHSCV